MKTPTQMLDGIDEISVSALPEGQNAMVDSMSLPHVTEYIAAKHALAQDHATLQLVNDSIEECRIHIARAQVQMRLLKRQRDAVQCRMSIHRARLSPLRAVPDQILQEIFQHCLPDSPYIVPDARSAPLVLTHVCRRWRVVAQGTSELWSSIALYDRGVWNYELEVKMTKQWLDRSRMRSIRMSITCPPCTDFGPDHGVLCSEIFQLVVAHSSQLQDVSLNVHKTYLRHFLDRASLLALQSITISLHSAHRIVESMETSMPSVISAPNLRCITFKGDGTSIDLIPRTILPQITHLSFDCYMTLDLALLFQDFVNLQHLTLALSLAGDALRFRLPLQSDHKIVVPSLLCLEVRFDKDMLEFGDPEELETLLDQLELPALQMLSITAPLRPQFDMVTGRREASWENHAAWVRSPSVVSLLSRSRYAQPLLECRDTGELSPWDQAAVMKFL